MCGLILAPERYLAEVDDALDLMHYRGPDSRGLVVSDGYVLGHTRLAIQDLSRAGEQPFEIPGGHAAFVGEFFVADKSEQRHVADLLDGSAEFERTDGFWALAALRNGGAEVYTDHLAIKPLYYWPEKQIVCSELEPMFLLEPRPAVDELFLSNCIKWGYDYSGRTPYQGIYKLGPGLRITLKDDRNPHIEGYWSWSKVNSDPMDLRATVDQAIHNRTIGDRKIAMLMSGGLDSSIIYYSLRSGGYDVEAFSFENGESEFLPSDVKILEPAKPVTIREAVKAMQVPIDLGSMVPQLELARAVQAAGYHICLSGDGADEVFGGYRRAQTYDSQYSDVFAELPFYHLPRLDRIMMRHTIELRSPYLAPKVIKAGLCLPHGLRTEKQWLKRAYHDLVPEKILNRTKHPLKTKAVRLGGEEYRAQLVKEWRHVFQSV